MDEGNIVWLPHYGDLNPQALRRLLQEKQFAILDVNVDDVFAKEVHPQEPPDVTSEGLSQRVEVHAPDAWEGAKRYPADTRFGRMIELELDVPFKPLGGIHGNRLTACALPVPPVWGTAPRMAWQVWTRVHLLHLPFDVMLLFDGTDSVDPWGIFTVYTLGTPGGRLGGC